MTDLPFGSTPVGVRALAGSISAGAEGLRPAGSLAPARTSDAQIELWLTEAGDLVSLQIRRYVALPVDATAAQIPGALTQDLVIAGARHLVQLYAAALLLDVNLPERSAQMRGESGRGPGAPLMDRFYKLLGQLTAQVEAGLLPGDTDVAGAGAGYRMPPPRYTSELGF